MKLHRYAHIDNKKFHNELSNRVDSSAVTEYMGECFINIGVGLSHRKNFQRYTYRDEMILDGIEDCVRYVHRFDTSKTNPHAYFSKVFERAFLRRIAKEKKQDYIRNKIKMEYLNLPDLDWVVEYERKNEVRLSRLRDKKTLLRFWK
jgi:hypothetical protein